MHDLSCRWSEGRHPRHSALNDIIHRSLSSAHISDTLAHSHVSSAAMSSGTVSKSRQNRPRGLSMPIWMQATTLSRWHAVETSGVLDPEALLFLWDLGHWLMQGGNRSPRAKVLLISPATYVCLWQHSEEMLRQCWEPSKDPWTWEGMGFDIV